jgi:hypothetical protein
MLLSLPQYQLWDLPPALLCKVGLLAHHRSQPLCLSQSLLGASSSSEKLACFPGQIQHSTPTSAVSVRLQFAVYVFQFCWEEDSVCPGTLLNNVPKWWIGESCVWCDAHLFILQIHTSSFGQREKWHHFSECIML